MCSLSGRSGWNQDPAEEVDHLPESPAGVLPPRASRLFQQPESRLHPAGAGLAGDHLLRHLPRSVVSRNDSGAKETTDITLFQTKTQIDVS